MSQHLTPPALAADLRVPHTYALHSLPINLAGAQKLVKTPKISEKRFAKLSVDAILNDVLRLMTASLRWSGGAGLIKKVRKNLQKRFDKIVDDDILRTRCPSRAG